MHIVASLPETGQPSQSPASAFGRRYYQEILDRKTGELVSVDRGDWITLGELGQMFGMGRRQTTTILRQMNFVQVEGGGRNCRHRLCEWAELRGLGKRLHRKSDRFPFDVISPEGVSWISKRWQQAVAEVERQTITGPVEEAKAALQHFQTARGRHEMAVVQMVRWIADFFPDLTHQQIATALDVSRQLVDRFMKERDRQRREAMALRSKLFPLSP